MTGGTILFWLMAVTASFGAVAVVVSQNVVRMAFWLIVSLGSTAGLFFLLHADFVAATQLLVYVGGTVVLLIFGVMLTASGPYNLVKMAPGNLIAVAAVGAGVFFVVYQGVSDVDWNRASLRLLAISPERFEDIRKNADKEDAQLLASAFQKQDIEGTQVYRLLSEKDLDDEAKSRLLALLEANDLSFAPATKTGGTIRPLGFSLLGSRPDRDLETPQGLQRLGDGYYVVKAVPTHRTMAEAGEENEEAHAGPTLSTGYLLPFEIASVHLLVVLIGAAYLARAKRRMQSTTTV